MRKVGAVTSRAVTCFPAESIRVLSLVMLDCAAHARFLCPLSAIAEKSGERSGATSVTTSWSRSITESWIPRRFLTAQESPPTSGSRDHSDAPISAAGPSIAGNMPARNRVILKTRLRRIVRSLQTSSPTAHAAKLGWIRCPWSQDSRVKTQYRIVTSLAIKCLLVVICAWTNAILGLVLLALKLSKSPAGVEERGSNLLAIKGTSYIHSASVSAKPSSTAVDTSAESAAARARRRQPRGGGRNGSPTKTTSPNTSVSSFAVAH